MKLAFEAPQNIYNTVMDKADAILLKILDIGDKVFFLFEAPVMLAATIYVALMGYAVLSGRVIINGNEAATRISKLILVVFFITSYGTFASWFYQIFWNVPMDIANLFAGQLAESGTTVTTQIGVAGSAGYLDTSRLGLNTAVMAYSDQATAVAEKIVTMSPDPDKGFWQAFGLWLLQMAPVLAALMIVVVAKIVSIFVFLLAPIVFLLLLFTDKFTSLVTWLKVLMGLGLTVVIALSLFVLSLEMLSQVVDVNLLNDPTDRVILSKMFPVGALSVISFLLIGQSPSIANAIIGTSGFNGGQITSIAQLGAIRGASV